MDGAVFQREDQKYSALWMNGYKDARWEKLAKVALRLASEIEGVPSLIDLGFGRGSAMDFFEERGLSVVGVDISECAVRRKVEEGKRVYHFSLDNLVSLKDGEFNIGFCNDVIEHLPEEYVVPSLNEMARVCLNYLLISVCPTPSHHLSLDEENLHLTVRPESWWERLFLDYGECQRVKISFRRSARCIIDLHKTE